MLVAMSETATSSKRTYRSLSYRFTLESNDDRLAREAEALIGDFARPAREPGPDRNGGSVAYSMITAAAVDGGPRHSLRRDQKEVIASDDPHVVVSRLLLEISRDTVELATGYLMIHAGVVVSAGGEGVVILGESGSGKTVLVAALVQEGFGYLSDEAAAIEIETGLAHPWPRPLGFKPGSWSLSRFAAVFATRLVPDGAAPADGVHVGIAQIRRGAIAGPCTVNHVIDHRYHPGAPTKLEPISRADAIVRMGRAAPRLRSEGDRGLGTLAGLMDGASAYTLVSGELELGVRKVRQLVER